MEAQHLNDAVARARLDPRGCVWTALQDGLGCDATSLQLTLDHAYGIRVLGTDDFENARLVDRVPGVGALIEWQGVRVLATNDPWSRGAQDAHRALVGTGAALALAPTAPLRALAPSPDAPGRAEAEGVSGFVDRAIAIALDERASDIHFETSRAGVAVKYRLDGVMCATSHVSALSEEVLSRIKVMAQLDITERRKPQDGRMHWQDGGGRSVDLRVSVMPSIFGEDAVLRLLDKAQLRQSASAITLDSLGFEGDGARLLRVLAEKPHGMMLVTGPTGSGKTTTVYAALSEVNSGIEKIITIEDPVEYELPGVLQIPVNEKKGLTFATGLRSILRHDPDKILVGEIRDAETAEIAVQSALTGHLVFTTVHANSLFDVLGRFQHFGIDPFALTSALNGIVVQRLLRRLCSLCMTWHERVPVANGCDHCRHTGYKGRFVVAEIHELDDEVRDLIIARASMTELKTRIYRSERNGLVAVALDRVAKGETTMEEVKRVIGLA